MLIFFAAVVCAFAAERPEKWAAPATCEGAPNLHKVAPFLYRSAQPTAQGFAALEKLGIKTIVNLRDHHSDADEARGTALRLERVDMDAWNIKDDDVLTVLATLRRAENGPFLIHCAHGADRTGVACAMFRIVEQGWTAKQAVEELKRGGYGFHKIWINIPDYLEGAEKRLPELRKRLDALEKQRRKQ